MTQQDNDQRLEAMLRKWGAQEAVTRASAGATPALPVAPLRRARWAPLLAAAAVVLAAGAAVITVLQRQNDLQVAADHSRGLEESLQEAKSSLGAKIEAAQQAQARRINELSLSKVGAEKMWADMVAQSEQKIASLTAELSQKEALLAKANADLTPAQSQLTLAGRRLADANAELDKDRAEIENGRKELALVRDEFNRLRKLYDESLEGAATKPGVIDEARARTAAAWDDFARAYLDATAPDETGFRAMQVSARQSKMVERCTKLRAAAKAEPARKLLDKIETVLTRLELIEPGNFEAEDSFRSLLNSSNVLKEIETALDAGPEAPTKSFLIEAKLIFSGAQRVG